MFGVPQSRNKNVQLSEIRGLFKTVTTEKVGMIRSDQWKHKLRVFRYAYNQLRYWYEGSSSSEKLQRQCGVGFSPAVDVPVDSVLKQSLILGVFSSHPDADPSTHRSGPHSCDFPVGLILIPKLQSRLSKSCGFQFNFKSTSA